MNESDTSHTGASHVRGDISIFQKLSLLLLILSKAPWILVRTAFDILRQRAFQGREVRLAFVRNISSLATLIPLSVSQSLAPITGTAVETFCKSRDITYTATLLRPEGGFVPGRVYEIEVDPAVRGGVLLYFHGGGYIRAAGPGFVELAFTLAKSLGCRQLRFLEYTLAPRAKYPTQLAQGAEALRLLLQVCPAEQIVIGGDSAGGNLTLGLLAHLKSPHPKIKPISLVGNLAAAVCISPRCSNGTSSPSFTYNSGQDILSVKTCQFFVAKWAPVDGEVWAAANDGGEVFWKEKESDVMAKKILLLGGERECYIDDIRRFARIIGASASETTPWNSSRQLRVAEGEIHDQASLDFGMGLGHGKMSSMLLTWAVENKVEV